MRIVLLFLILLRFSFVHGQTDRTERRLVKYIDETNEEALTFLKELVSINSGTMNFEGVKQVGQMLIPKFQALGMETLWIDGKAFNRAGHLVAKTKGGSGKKILLIGHLDTVFEPDSPFQQWEQIDENTIKGPGIADMKGGDVIIVQSLSALYDLGLLENMNIQVIMTGDEEFSGSPLSLSKEALIEGAKWADVALGFENADGNPKTANVSRRSASRWILSVSGNAAHSSQVFKPKVGSGAIFEASRILYEFHQQLSNEEFLTFNPGVLLGGTSLSLDTVNGSGAAAGKDNVVAQQVVAKGDIRCLSVDQLKKAQAKMEEIVANNLPETSASIIFYEGYPPFEPKKENFELLKLYSQVSTDLGYGEVTPVDPNDAGAADISFTSPYIEMGLDGLGLSGADDHTINETGDIRALSMQSKRAAILLYRLTRN